MDSEEKKFAIITTVSGGYMFALNANFNTNKYYGTNADYHVIYHDSIDEEYRKACTEAFKKDFNIIWFPMTGFDCDFHNSKYKYARMMTEEYDAICLIDTDLFIVTNLLKYFHEVAGTKKFISAQHLWSGGIKENLYNIPWEAVKDRMHAQIADFPVFIDSRKADQFFQDWEDFTKAGNAEENHPLVAFNRSIAKNFFLENVETLPGDLWVADKEFWTTRYDWNREKNCLIGTANQDGVHQEKSICAIHNKWWKEGRANGEFRAHQWVTKDPAHQLYYDNLLRGEHNFNEIRDMMAFFNDMTPATRRDDYLQEKISMAAILPQLA